jgi:hypothetical protein
MGTEVSQVNLFSRVFRRPAECTPVPQPINAADIALWMREIREWDAAFMNKFRKSSAIDVEFRTVEESKQLTNGEANVSEPAHQITTTNHPR